MRFDCVKLTDAYKALPAGSKPCWAGLVDGSWEVRGKPASFSVKKIQVVNRSHRSFYGFASSYAGGTILTTVRVYGVRHSAINMASFDLDGNRTSCGTLLRRQGRKTREYGTGFCASALSSFAGGTGELGEVGQLHSDIDAMSSEEPVDRAIHGVVVVQKTGDVAKVETHPLASLLRRAITPAYKPCGISFTRNTPNGRVTASCLVKDLHRGVKGLSGQFFYTLDYGPEAGKAYGPFFAESFTTRGDKKVLEIAELRLKDFAQGSELRSVSIHGSGVHPIDAVPSEVEDYIFRWYSLWAESKADADAICIKIREQAKSRSKAAKPKLYKGNSFEALATEDPDSSYVMGLSGLVVPNAKFLDIAACLIEKRRGGESSDRPLQRRRDNYKGAQRRLKKKISTCSAPVFAFHLGNVVTQCLNIPARRATLRRCRSLASASRSVLCFRAALRTGIDIPKFKDLEEILNKTKAPKSLRNHLTRRLTGLRSTALFSARGKDA